MDGVMKGDDTLFETDRSIFLCCYISLEILPSSAAFDQTINQTLNKQPSSPSATAQLQATRSITKAKNFQSTDNMGFIGPRWSKVGLLSAACTHDRLLTSLSRA